MEGLSAVCGLPMSCMTVSVHVRWGRPIYVLSACAVLQPLPVLECRCRPSGQPDTSALPLAWRRPSHGVAGLAICAEAAGLTSCAGVAGLGGVRRAAAALAAASSTSCLTAAGHSTTAARYSDMMPRPSCEHNTCSALLLSGCNCSASAWKVLACAGREGAERWVGRHRHSVLASFSSGRRAV